MKPLTLILLGSVALNAVLGISYHLRARNGSLKASAATPFQPAQGEDAAAEIWAEIEASTSGDPAALVARLRAEKFPPEITRAIVLARLQEQYAEKFKALAPDDWNREYWKSYASQRSGDAETRAAQRKLQREFAEQVRQLLGEDTSVGLQQAIEERQYGNLAKDKIEQLKLITQDYGDLKAQLQSEAKGVLLPEDLEKLAYLEREKQADLAALLTPQEIEQYERRNSQTANQLKARLSLFDATEQEYLALYALQKSFDDKFAVHDAFYSSAQSQEQRRARAEAQQQLTKDIEAALGPERFREYQIKSDHEYRQVNALAERLKLPESAARDVVSLKLETQERVKSIFAQNLKDITGNDAKEQVQARLAALVEDVEARLRRTLGDEGYAAYRDRAKNWVPTVRSIQK